MSESDNEILKKQLKENITDSGIEELIITKQKLEEKEDTIDELNKKIEEYEDLLKRKMADFENFKRRTKTELEDKEIFANQKLVEDILPIVDNFEKAVEAAENNADFNALFDGIKLVEKQFKQVLMKYNVIPLDSIGKEFDPNLHDALMIDESGNYSQDTVIKEWQKGYLMGDKVIRHAQVVVGKAKAGGSKPKDVDAQSEPIEPASTKKKTANDNDINSEFVPPKNDVPKDNQNEDDTDLA